MELLEEFKVLFLNRANRVLQIFPVSSGGITGTVADPRLIISRSYQGAACSMVLVHNHQCGKLLPSRADAQLTQKMKEAAKYFDIKCWIIIIKKDEAE